MSDTAEMRRHPVGAAVESLHAQLDELSDSSVWSMSSTECLEVVASLTRLSARVAELELRMVAEAEHRDLGRDQGATTTTLWWADQTRLTRAQAHGRMHLARSLGEHESVRTALAAGELQPDQARVIVEAVDALPQALSDDGSEDPSREVPGGLTERATTHLLELATQHDARSLRILGRRILEVLAPDIAEAQEQKALEREEAQAAQQVWFSVRDDGHGTCHGRFRLPTLQGELLMTQLRALAAPHHRPSPGASPGIGTGTGEDTGTGTGSPPTENPHYKDSASKPVKGPLRLGWAFVEYIETRAGNASGRTPKAGGLPATLVVTMTMQQLESGLGAVSLHSGHRITAGQARRLACGAGIIPAVLGGESQVLDIGRRRRLHTEAQRTALGLRDGGCTAVGCDWPPGMCHAHHDQPWALGGSTSVESGRLLCPRHHRYAHDPNYQLTYHPNGTVSFARRTSRPSTRAAG